MIFYAFKLIYLNAAPTLSLTVFVAIDFNSFVILKVV